MNPFENTVFRRRFSVNPYKSLTLPLGEMSCCKDWVNTKRGDPYPVLEKGKVRESIENGRYRVINETSGVQKVSRLLGSHFPACTYELRLEKLTCAAGFTVSYPGQWISLLARHNGTSFEIEVRTASGGLQKYEYAQPFTPGTRFMVTANFTHFEMFIASDEVPQFVAMYTYEAFKGVNQYRNYSRAAAALTAELSPGEEAALNARFYMDCGVSQADLRSVRYEDGTPLIEHGRMYITFSVRNIDHGFQGVMSWTPGLNDFRMEGALFFDPGDGTYVGEESICGDVASTLIYDRTRGEWLLWACSFSHGHILCHTRTRHDPRFGINVLDVTLMKAESPELTLSDDRLFLAKAGDEDPDLVWDAENSRWLMSICRLTETSAGATEYRYFVFEGSDPFEGFTYIGNTTEGSGTGGSFIAVNGKRYLLSGANFGKRANYYLYPLEELSSHSMLKFDYDDGGFRGWGTLIQAPSGTRTRNFLLTFDRHNGGTGNWTYGNLYVFEAVPDN